MKRWSWSVGLVLVLAVFLMGASVGCDPKEPKADTVQRAQQEALLQEATAQTGMPSIKNFRERKILKDILELRDQTGLVTYTYLFSDLNAKPYFFGQTVGYPIPYATQYTNPQKIEVAAHSYGYAILPQADPNALFSPSSAEGTWVLMKDPNGTEVRPVYVEPRVIALPFKLPARSCWE